MPEIMKPRQYRHLGRIAQIPLFMGKLLRSFVYQNDWKVLPMTAIVAALVAMVVRRVMFVNMEGTLMGSFALTCVSIWNGCFNSIQAICRERDIIKREHRSGMHVTSYVFSHMLYQALLCLVQTVLTLYVCYSAGMKFPREGFMTSFLIVDIGISVFLITYAADMLSLLISALSRTTTAAMTVMPFILIFQLVFSGGFFSLPHWAERFANITISNYGLKSISAQANYNELPLASGWNTLYKLEGEEISGTVTLGEALDLLQDEEKTVVRDIRQKEIRGEDIQNIILGMAEDKPEALLLENALNLKDTTVTVGDIVDAAASEPSIIAQREKSYDFSVKIGDIIQLFGEDAVRQVVEEKASAASYEPDYERSVNNIVNCWLHLAFFSFVYSLIAVIALEFIDKDKR